MFLFNIIFNQTPLQSVNSFTGAALQFLNRMAEELGLPMKMIEVCVSDGNVIHEANIPVPVLNKHRHR